MADDHRLLNDPGVGNEEAGAYDTDSSGDTDDGTFFPVEDRPTTAFGGPSMKSTMLSAVLNDRGEELDDRPSLSRDGTAAGATKSDGSGDWTRLQRLYGWAPTCVRLFKNCCAWTFCIFGPLVRRQL